MASLFYALRDKLASLFPRIRYRSRMLRLALVIQPMAGGSGEGEEESEGAAGEGEGSVSGEGEEESEGAAEAEVEGEGSGEPDWKRMARKHEREAKKAREHADKLTRKLKEREDNEKSEHEKALEEAKTATRAELQTEFDKERRQDRLEVATTKLAAKGITVGSGDKAKTLKFADPDDALVHLERAIRNGDVDEDDIFDDKGKVRTDQLTEALTDLLASKPHLAAETKPRKVEGTGDGGKGGPADSGDSSVEDEIGKIRRHAGGNERSTQGARSRQAA